MHSVHHITFIQYLLPSPSNSGLPYSKPTHYHLSYAATYYLIRIYPYNIEYGRDDGKPVVIVASDQNFPPVLYSKDGDACIAILRIEFGTAKELGFAVGDMLHGVSLPAGSVVLV
jgi:hypothetical protein